MLPLRVAGVLAALASIVAAVLLSFAVGATQGPLYRGYVSEAGVPGQPHALIYRVGVYAVAVGLLLLAVAVRAWAALPAVLLAVAALLAGVSAAVSCSPGCPLPPYETPTPRDLVHGGASTVGVGLAALAVLVIAVGRRAGRLRRLSRGFLWPMVPLSAVMAFVLAFVGRSWTLGVTERALLIAILAWITLAGLTVERPDTLTD
jgi:hypothetical protein